MIEIYRKLPGTNCGQCGQSSCMAFALLVKKSRAGLTQCPFAAGGGTVEGQASSDASSSGTYEQVARELEKEAAGKDFKESAEAVGGTYRATDGNEAIAITMISTGYELRKEGLFHHNAYCADVWARIIICDYLRRQGKRPLTGQWIPLGAFPRAASLTRAFQSSAEKKIATAFKKDLKGLKERSSALGGSEIEGNVKTDYCGRFDLLPHVPLYLSFWVADDEFDADCKLLFDRSAEGHIDIQYLAYLVERFANELTNS